MPTIEGTIVNEYLKIAVNEASPQVYKPRQGKVSANFDKFDQTHKDFIVEYAHKHLRMFDYYDLFLKHGANPVAAIAEDSDIDDFMVKFNKKETERSLQMAKAADKFDSIFVNYSALLIRLISEKFPQGKRFIRF